MDDINELGNIVAGAFAHPDESGNGQYLPLVGDFMSNEIVETLNRQGQAVVKVSLRLVTYPSPSQHASIRITPHRKLNGQS